MESGKVFLGICLVVAIVTAVAVTVLYFGDEKTDFGLDNPKNPELVCEIVGYTNAIEARLNASEPVPGYITEKYGEIYIPPDVKTYDLVEFSDFGLSQDNTTSLVTRIYDVEYDLNYNFIDTRMQNENLSVDTYSGIISYINDSESAVALIFESRDINDGGFSYFFLNIQFQSESGDNFGIYIRPVQGTESAMRSSELLYIIYSSKDVDHDYRLSMPESSAISFPATDT